MHILLVFQPYCVLVDDLHVHCGGFVALCRLISKSDVLLLPSTLSICLLHSFIIVCLFPTLLCPLSRRESRCTVVFGTLDVNAS